VAALSFIGVTYECEVQALLVSGRYRVDRIGGDWELSFLCNGKRTPINAMDVDGSPVDWPSIGTARLAAEKHYALLMSGLSPDVAAARVQALADDYERQIDHEEPETVALRPAQGWR
jgi:hypothetical protein